MEGGGKEGRGPNAKGNRKVDIQEHNERSKRKEQNAKEKKSLGSSRGKREGKKNYDKKAKAPSETEQEPDQKEKETKEPCDHSYCNPPESNPSYFPKGLPWAGDKLKCLPGHCKDHQKFADDAKQKEDASFNAKVSREKLREQNERKQDMERIDDAREEVLFILKMLEVSTQPGMKSWVNEKLEKIRKENEESQDASKPQSTDFKKSENIPKHPSRDKSGASQKSAAKSTSNTRVKPPSGEDPKSAPTGDAVSGADLDNQLPGPPPPEEKTVEPSPPREEQPPVSADAQRQSPERQEQSTAETQSPPPDAQTSSPEAEELPNTSPEPR